MSELSKRRVGPLKLKLLGITEPELSKYRAEAAELGVSNLVDLPGRLPDDELQAIFQAAWAYVLPSLYEGFGIPILEAQAAGALLIASDLPIMHEVSGEAACFVKPPASPGAWADAIERMLLEPNQVQSLRTAGWKNAQQFTWDRAADATVDVYEKLVS
jgi:glycosyltransferase involved in cell wall biosynthesis